MPDYARECRSLVKMLEANGWRVIRVCHEDDVPVDTVAEAVEEMTACDECEARFTNDGEDMVAVLVLGNGPGELVCDSWRITGCSSKAQDDFEHICASWSACQRSIAKNP